MQSASKDGTFKLGVVQQQLEQNKRDNKRSWDFVLKELEGVQEQQRHAKTANQPLHKIITNVTTQLDELGHQHLGDIKSIMQLNQSTSEKQFEQIKGLQIQMQKIWGRLSNQEQNRHELNHNAAVRSPNAHTFKSPNASNAYRVRPESYKSEMSSTAAFNAIKQHLSGMPGKPSAETAEADEFGDVDEFVAEESPKLSPRGAKLKSMESASEFLERSPRPTSARPKEMDRMERKPIARNEATTVVYTPNDDLRSAVKEASAEDEEEDYDDEYDEDGDEETEEKQPPNARETDAVNEVENAAQQSDVDDGDIDDMLGDEDTDALRPSPTEDAQDPIADKSDDSNDSIPDCRRWNSGPANEKTIESTEVNSKEPRANADTKGDIDAVFGDDIVDRADIDDTVIEKETISNEKSLSPKVEVNAEEEEAAYSEQENEQEQNGEEEEVEVEAEKAETSEHEEEEPYSEEEESAHNDGDDQIMDQEKALTMLEQEQSEMTEMTEQEKALAMLEQEQSEINEPSEPKAKDPSEYSDF